MGVAKLTEKLTWHLVPCADHTQILATFEAYEFREVQYHVRAWATEHPKAAHEHSLLTLLCVIPVQADPHGEFLYSDSDITTWAGFDDSETTES